MIVESPAKAKTIEKYLGKEFTVKSCYGHIRDLPKKDTGVDVKNNFAPNYIVPDDKKKIVGELKKLAKGAEVVWLATDEDREGEAISWHLCEVLGLNPAETKRIVFHEITKTAIQKAVKTPRFIDQNLVDAQQARRILDRLVGFEISPVLWRKVKGKLSAGRVQSVAVRVVVEREREIRDFEVQDNYKISALFQLDDDLGKQVMVKAELPKRFATEKEATDFLNRCIGAAYTIEEIKVKPAKKSPPPSFTTSTLQQDASRRLGYSVSRTMMIAQKLYEGGHITYMRTDSTNLSDTARAAINSEVLERYGEKYQQPRQFKSKAKGAQEAHEAIRPTNFAKEDAGSNSSEKSLYRLIWRRAMASQMADAQLERTTAVINISTTSERLSAKGEVLKFDGFLKLYREATDDDENPKEDSGMLPPLSVGQVLDLNQMKAVQRFTRPPARYNEANLVKKLEELGVGRPSTYAPTISTIQNREYVVREDRPGKERVYKQFTLFGPNVPPNNGKIIASEGKDNVGVEKAKLFPTDVGKVVNDFLVEHFENVLNYSFTAKIEKQFDEIAEGKMEWNQMLQNFYQPFHKTVENTLENAERMTAQRELGTHPKSGKPVFAKLGRYGPMVQVGTLEDEEKPTFSKIRSPLTLDSITLEEALELFKLPRTLGNFEDTEVKVNQGRFGPYVLHNKKFYSLPKGADPMEFTFAEAELLIKTKREEDAKKMILDFSEHDIQVLNGRYGPYIKAGKKNVKIPKDKVPAELTLEECQELVANAPEKKGRGRGRTTKAKKK